MAPRDGSGLDLGDDGRRLFGAGVVLGLGLGGFFDGIVFHQILQWHHLVSNHPDATVASDLAFNVLVDGLFHVVTYLLTIAGVALVWRAWRRAGVRPPGRLLPGGALVGWGLFNLVEGTLLHHVLALHHVRPDGPGSVLFWDLAFLAWGVAFVVLGAIVVWSAPPERAPQDVAA